MQTVLHGAYSVDNNGRIDRVNLADDGGGERRFMGGGASYQEGSPVQPLLQGEVCRDLAVGIEAILFDCGNDSDDGDGLFRVEPEVLADGVVVRPEALGEVLVDDDNLRCIGAVVVGEEAARSERNLHGAEIVSACGAQIDLQLLTGRWIVSLDVDSSPTHGSCEGEGRDRAFGDDAWQVGDAGFDIAIESGDHLLVAVSRVVHHDLHGEDVVRREPG